MNRIPPLSPPGGSSEPDYGQGWDLVTIGGIRLPGKSRITKGGVALKRDAKKKAGAHGGLPTYHGLDGQEFEVESIQHTDAQRALTLGVHEKLAPRPGATPKPLPLEHPSLAVIPFPIYVVLDEAGIMEVIGPCTTRTRLKGRHWIKPESTTPAGKPVTTTPTYQTRNLQQEDAARRARDNPLPTARPGAAQP